MIIRSKNIYTEDGIVDGYLVVEGGKIKEILGSDAAVTEYEDYSEYRIIPGIFDTHNHGVMGYSLMDSASEKDVKGYLKGLASQGVTSIFPTASTEAIKVVAKVAKEENDGAKILGIHSEGPYLNRVGEKGINTGYPEVDMDFVKKMVEDGDGLLRLVALAPEIEGTDKVIDYLTSNGIRVAYAHSDCNYQEALDSFKKGITVGTHTANVMSGIHHRNMGGLGACLLDEDLWCEVICDGLHVSTEMLEIMFKVKPYHKFMMISDNAPMAGAPVGRYNLNGWMEVNVDQQGFCLSDTGRLCGSTKPVLYGIGVLVNKLHIPLETVVQMASLNPAIVYGFEQEKGSIKKGKDADFVVIDEQYNAMCTFSEGKKIYDYQIDNDLFNPVFLKEAKIG